MNFIKGLSCEFYWRVVQRMLLEGCPMSFIGGLSNIFILQGCPMGFFYRRLVQRIYIGGLSNGFQKQKSFVLKTVFVHSKRMCEGVSEDSRHEAWHVDINVEMCMFFT